VLFTYQYVPHGLEKLQEWMTHLVKDVWCKPQRHFHLRMLTPDFRAVVKETVRQSKKHDYLWMPIRRIHNICRDHLSTAQRADFAKWFDDNINIEFLCAGTVGISPITYPAVAAVNVELARELESFCTNFWTHVRKLKPVSDRLGTLEQHFKEFRKVNRTAICPYCGISRIEGEFSETQEDYDHFLPKGTYPFNAVAMRNLAPICDKCNKKFKLQQDPLHYGGVRKKAFYSYSTAPMDCSIGLKLVPVNGAPIVARKLCPKNIQLEFSAPGRVEEVEGWKRVFGLEGRYKDICCQGKSDGAGGGYWLEQALGEMRANGMNPTAALETIARAASVSKWADVNFLKVPFLNACQAAKLIR
jgi:hypothetical protein